MAFRHVEALRSLGYRAIVRQPPRLEPPGWFEHDAPVEDASTPLGEDDILVLPEDSHELFLLCAGLPNRKVVFCQNPLGITGPGLAAVPAEVRQGYRTFIACGAGVAALIARYFDYELISVVPAFADERRFRPRPKEQVIACAPRKRPAEMKAIRYMFERLHPNAAAWRWEVLETATEDETAAAMGRASVFLSLARLEAVALTILEAMACECLVAGFTGIGPREYTSATNGIWVEEDDVEAAAQALVRAVTLAERGGGGVALMRHAARATAANWTHAACVRALASFWRDQMGVAP
jgi:hypothetical protein